MKNPGEYVDIGDPALQVRTDEDGNTVASATIQAVVLWKEDIKNHIMDEIIKMCKEHGITDLYVLNRDFILSAIKALPVNFCPNCGAPMTDKAVEMVMERLEVFYD